jgi:hypothetical protein
MDKRTIARDAKAKVDTLRSQVDKRRDLWPGMNGLLGINKRWLRAFASGQIQNPPADRFVAVEAYIGTLQKRSPAVARRA